MTLTSTGDNRKQSLLDDVREGSSSISTNVADRSNSNHLIPLSPEQQRELEEELLKSNKLTDSEEEDEFIRRFGILNSNILSHQNKVYGLDVLMH